MILRSPSTFCRLEVKLEISAKLAEAGSRHSVTFIPVNDKVSGSAIFYLCMKMKMLKLNNNQKGECGCGRFFECWSSSIHKRVLRFSLGIMRFIGMNNM